MQYHSVDCGAMQGSHDFARFFPDESNRKKSIKTTQMTGLYKGFGHVLQKASIEEISF